MKRVVLILALPAREAAVSSEGRLFSSVGVTASCFPFRSRGSHAACLAGGPAPPLRETQKRGIRLALPRSSALPNPDK